METDNVAHFRHITEQMADIYEKKNHDYGNSFGDSFAEFGAIAGVVRIGDKYNRIKSLTGTDTDIRVNDESVADTLLDMANYCIMMYMEIVNRQVKPAKAHEETPKPKNPLKRAWTRFKKDAGRNRRCKG